MLDFSSLDVTFKYSWSLFIFFFFFKQFFFFLSFSLFFFLFFVLFCFCFSPYFFILLMIQLINFFFFFFWGGGGGGLRVYGWNLEDKRLRLIRYNTRRKLREFPVPYKPHWVLYHSQSLIHWELIAKESKAPLRFLTAKLSRTQWGGHRLAWSGKERCRAKDSSHYFDAVDRFETRHRINVRFNANYFQRYLSQI